jgi:formate dehydrogenase subunit delta
VKVERLVAMANDIAAFFSGEPDRDEAIAGTLQHLSRFWDPRMQRQIAAHAREGGEGLSEVAQAAVLRLDSIRKF